MDSLRDQLFAVAFDSLGKSQRQQLVEMLKTIQSNLVSAPALSDPEKIASE
jgi:hypothetical protein